MKKILKWIGIALAGVVGLIVVAAALVFLVSNGRINQTYAIPQEAVPIASDAETLARGEHIATIRGCADCHGPNLAGGPFIEDPAIAMLNASNLTAGEGGVGRSYTDADWVRAIRHGVGPDGKPLLFMPAQEFYYLSDEDLGVLIAYLKSIPAVDNELPENSVGPLGRILFLAGQFPLIPAELIDHEGARPTSPSPGVTVEYGRYLAVGCMGCHGPDYAGGAIPGAPPDWPRAANLTPAGHISEWTEADFSQALRTGVKPNGQRLSEIMPFQSIGAMSDDEIKAVWLFLQSLPPVQSE